MTNGSHVPENSYGCSFSFLTAAVLVSLGLHSYSRTFKNIRTTWLGSRVGVCTPAIFHPRVPPDAMSSFVVVDSGRVKETLTMMMLQRCVL
jgi:hypothetical protein